MLVNSVLLKITKGIDQIVDAFSITGLIVVSVDEKT